MTYSELQIFFYDRMIELFKKDTIDSYRVRCHNSLSLLEEAIYLIQSWNENKIKLFETIKICLDELLDTIKNDECIDFSFYDNQLFINEINEYIKTEGKETSKANYLTYVLNRCLEHNRPKYIRLSFQKIEDIIFKRGRFRKENLTPILQQLDALITNLGCELQNIGFSKINIYLKTKKAFENSHDFQSDFQQYKEYFSNTEKSKFTVVFKFNINKRLSDLDIFQKSLDPAFITNFTRTLKTFITPQPYMRYYWTDILSLDQSSAVKEAKNKLLLLLDNFHLGLNSLDIRIPYKALVFKDEGNGTFCSNMTTDYEIDGSFSDDIDKALKFERMLDNIMNNPAIEHGVKDRIKSAIRHLRIAKVNTEIEQRFINYWIALEFIFSTADKSIGTFTKLQTHLKQILTACYCKRNLIYINSLLVDYGIIGGDEHFWEMNENERDSIIYSSDSIWLKYRYSCIKAALLTHSDKRKEYIKSHEKHLTQQIARIYRLRNELIHEAAIKHDLENITGNLRYYLAFLLNQMIGFYYNISDKKEHILLDDFFYENQMRYRNIKANHSFESIIDFPIEMDLL